MTNAQLLGDFSIDNYQLYSLGHYPGAVPGNGTVHGEVYRIDNATLAELDALRTRAVTVIEVEANRVTQVKDLANDGYRAIQVTTGAKKANRVTKPEAGHFAKAGVEAGRGLSLLCATSSLCPRQGESALSGASW